MHQHGSFLFIPEYDQMAVKKEKNNEIRWIEGAYSHFADKHIKRSTP